MIFHTLWAYEQHIRLIETTTQPPTPTPAPIPKFKIGVGIVDLCYFDRGYCVSTSMCGGLCGL